MRSFCYESFDEATERRAKDSIIKSIMPADSSTRNVGNTEENEDKRIKRKQFHYASVGILSVALANVELHRKY